jgi:hypothetical protein
MHAEAACKTGVDDRRLSREEIQTKVDQADFDFSFYISPEPICFL